MDSRYLLALQFLLLILPVAAASSAPDVTLVSPADGNVSTSSSVTFVCNVTDDENLFSISLYHGSGGAFDLYGTKRLMELEQDSKTTLLCHFSDTYVCETGDAGTGTSTSFVSGKFMQGVMVNDSDTLTYQTSGNMDYQKGTVEFWFSLGSVPDVANAWLFSTGSSNANEIQIYMDDNNLSFMYYESGASSRASKDVSAWNKDEWHHVAAIWDIYYYVGSGEILDIFLDGSNESVIYEASHYGHGSFGPSMYIGSYADGSRQSNSTFDELRISNAARSPSEINASYMRVYGNYSKESANWTISLPDGFYKWNCLAYDNESQGSWNGTNNTLYVDTSPPYISRITLSPNSTDEVDPESTSYLTANVTDLVNVSHVVMQWKETGDWNNDTMEYNSSTGLYGNASITFDQTGGVYYYRLWTNDTLGHSASSATYNVTAEWDYTWSGSPSSLGTAYGIIGCPDCYVGVITINNTGDDTLSIQMTDNWPLGIHYNVSNPFLIGPKNVTHINVTAEFSNENSEYAVVINITASHGSETPSPLYHTVDVIINSYSGGPYFDDDDLTLVYPASAYQGMSYNLSARLKNIGNESAAGVWINYSLPAGWTKMSGNLSGYISSLNGTAGGGNIAWNNVTVYLAPGSATTGLHNVYVNASSGDNLTGNTSASIYVLCNSDDGICGAGCNYFSDDDCSQPAQGGVVTVVPALAAREAVLKVEAPERFDLKRGESGTFTAYIYNTVVGTVVKEVTLQVSGYPKTQTSISPAIVDSLAYGEKKPFRVEINVPEYTAYGKYELVLEARGTYSAKTLTADARVILFVQSATENETMEILYESRERLDEMTGMGLNTGVLGSLSEQATAALEEKDYDKAIGLGNEIIRISGIAFRVSDILKQLEGRIRNAMSYGIDVPETRKMYTLALAAFQRGDYERANERAGSALLTYSAETGGLVEAFSFIYGYWWVLIIVIIAMVAFFWRAHRMIIIRSISGKLERMGLEEKAALGMMRDYRKRYWQDRSVSAEDYRKSLYEQENRILDISKRRSELVIRKIRLTADNALQALEKEMESVKRRMSDLQNRYFCDRELSKSTYLMMMNGLSTEMTNLQSGIDTMKAGSVTPRRSGFSRHAAVLAAVLIAILLSMFLMPYSGALDEQGRALEAISKAEAEILSMQELGFGTNYANDTLNEAKLLYNQGNYLAAESLAERVAEIKNLAIEIDSLIDQVEGMLYESSALGIDVSPAESLFEQSITAFGIEDYVQAKDLLDQAINTLDELESEAALQKASQKTWYSDMVSFLGYWKFALLAATIVVLCTSYALYIKRKSRNIRKRFRSLGEEKDRLEKLLKDLQSRYFSDSLISKPEYERLKDHYRKSLADVERKLKLMNR